MHLTCGTDHQTHGTMTSQLVQSAFVKDVQSIVSVMEDFGNPLEEESQDLMVLDTKEIAPPAAVDALRHAHEVGQLHFDNFVRERLVERTKRLEDAIHRHKFSIFVHPPKVPRKGANQVKSLQNNVSRFCRLYIRCQNRDGNWKNSYSMKTKPALLLSQLAVVSVRVPRAIFLRA